MPPQVNPTVDARISKLLAEAWRHAKAIGALPAGGTVLAESQISPEEPGVIVAPTDELVSGLADLLSQHRVWSRFTPIAS
jgi:catalase